MTGPWHRLEAGSGAPWEARVGYSRVVRVGPLVFVSGCTAIDAGGNVVGVGDAYAQAIQTLRNVSTALARVGAGLEHVVRTRIYVTDIEQWEPVGRAHAEVFGTIRPATALVEVRRLIRSEMLVEIEADAVVSDVP